MFIEPHIKGQCGGWIEVICGSMVSGKTEELLRRLRRADGKIGGLVLLDVPGRIARLLLDAASDGGSDTIDKPLTHQTIAHMIGASRETVSRAMSEFQEGGLISVVRRRITKS